MYGLSRSSEADRARPSRGRSGRNFQVRRNGATRDAARSRPPRASEASPRSGASGPSRPASEEGQTKGWKSAPRTGLAGHRPTAKGGVTSVRPGALAPRTTLRRPRRPPLPQRPRPPLPQDLSPEEPLGDPSTSLLRATSRTWVWPPEAVGSGDQPPTRPPRRPSNQVLASLRAVALRTPRAARRDSGFRAKRPAISGSGVIARAWRGAASANRVADGWKVSVGSQGWATSSLYVAVAAEVEGAFQPLSVPLQRLLTPLCLEPSRVREVREPLQARSSAGAAGRLPCVVGRNLSRAVPGLLGASSSPGTPPVDPAWSSPA